MVRRYDAGNICVVRAYGTSNAGFLWGEGKAGSCNGSGGGYMGSGSLSSTLSQVNGGGLGNAFGSISIVRATPSMFLYFMSIEIRGRVVKNRVNKSEVIQRLKESWFRLDLKKHESLTDSRVNANTKP